jgi:hypothetical protein
MIHLPIEHENAYSSYGRLEYDLAWNFEVLFAEFKRARCHLNETFSTS